MAEKPLLEEKPVVDQKNQVKIYDVEQCVVISACLYFNDSVNADITILNSSV